MRGRRNLRTAFGIDPVSRGADDGVERSHGVAVSRKFGDPASSETPRVVVGGPMPLNGISGPTRRQYVVVSSVLPNGQREGSPFKQVLVGPLLDKRVEYAIASVALSLSREEAS